jgi:hypothetical protein
VKWSGAAARRWASALSRKGCTIVRPDVIIPVLMSCALLWWISRGMNWTTRLVVAAITLVVIVGILTLERALQ